MKDYQLIAWDGRVLNEAGTTEVPNPTWIDLAEVAGGAAGVGLGSVVGRVYVQCTENYNNTNQVRFRAFLDNAGDSSGSLWDDGGSLIGDTEVNTADAVAGFVFINAVLPSTPNILLATHIRFRFDTTGGSVPTRGAVFAGFSLESEGLRGQRPGQQLRGARGPWQSQYTAGFNPNTPS